VRTQSQSIFTCFLRAENILPANTKTTKVQAAPSDRWTRTDVGHPPRGPKAKTAAKKVKQVSRHLQVLSEFVPEAVAGQGEEQAGAGAEHGKTGPGFDTVDGLAAHLDLDLDLTTRLTFDPALTFDPDLSAPQPAYDAALPAGATLVDLTAPPRAAFDPGRTRVGKDATKGAEAAMADAGCTDCEQVPHGAHCSHSGYHVGEVLSCADREQLRLAVMMGWMPDDARKGCPKCKRSEDEAADAEQPSKRPRCASPSNPSASHSNQPARIEVVARCCWAREA
jgi:hypothetical protein